jgi:hypothetical protein
MVSTGETTGGLDDRGPPNCGFLRTQAIKEDGLHTPTIAPVAAINRAWQHSQA